MGVEKQIESLENFFRRVDFPLQPLHYDTKVVLETFFDKGGFLNICDLIFGEYGSGYRVHKPDEMSWMDIGNYQPNGKVASALFRLLAPGSSFCNLLEAVSLPPTNFFARLKKSWKQDTDMESDTALSGCFFDIPLSFLYQSSYELLTEPVETNLCALPRSRCPPLLLIPFWNPPLVTRYEVDHSQVLTSLPCTPISFFILRMLLYVTRRAERRGARMVRLHRTDTLRKKMHSYAQYVLNFFRTSPSLEFPLYHRLLTAYIQYFVSPAFVERISLKRSLEEVQWSTANVTAALLLSAPSLIWMRGNRQPDLEMHRLPSRDIVSAALVLRLIPFLTECFLALNRKGEGNISNTPQSRFALLMKKDFYSDISSVSSWDILNLDLSFYRNSLIALRQSLISFEGFQDCRREHFNNVFELWLAMIKPVHLVEEYRETYVIQHYEAYSFILVDVFTMLLRSSFLTYIDSTGASMWKQCIEVFTMSSPQNVFREINSGNQSTVEAVSQYFTLNWTGSDGAVHAPNLFGDETLDLAARVYVAFETRLQVGDLEELTVTLLRTSRDLLSGIFDRLPFFIEKHQSKRRCSVSSAKDDTGIASSQVREMDTSIFENRDLFFKGIRRSCEFEEFIKLKFPTDGNSVPGGYNPALEASFRNEFPCLISSTRSLDFFFEKIIAWYYSSWIPRCSRGHSMWLLYSDQATCMNHLDQPAIWECALCEEVYGSCCRFNPYGRNGQPLHRVVNSNNDLTIYCWECCSFFQLHSVFYMSTETKQNFCPDCASRPFKKRSSRFLASYKMGTFTLFAIILFFCYVFI